MPDDPKDGATPADDGGKATPPAEPKKDDEPLGEAGKKALEAEREARREAEARAKAAERTAREATSDRDKVIAEAKAEARREILEEANRRLLHAEVKVAATGKLANPDRAMQLLDLSQFKVADDGTVDGKAITKAIDDLLETDPYLAAKTQPAGSADGGRQGITPEKKPDMNSLLRAAAKSG